MMLGGDNILAGIELKSQRGNPVFVYGDRTYIKNSSRHNSNRSIFVEDYRCRTSGCIGRLSKIFKTDVNGQGIGMPDILSVESSHIISCVGDSNSILH